VEIVCNYREYKREEKQFIFAIWEYVCCSCTL